MAKKERNTGKKRNTWEEIWHFIWYSNSPWSWLVNIILAFLLIKFLIYPALGAAFGTNLPIVAVISSSMEHPEGENWFFTDPAICKIGGCVQMEWYMEHNITEKDFDKFRFSNGFNTGDLMIIASSDFENTNIGDVIVFYRSAADRTSIPIIHRVVEKGNKEGVEFYKTKGDNNYGFGKPSSNFPDLDEEYVVADSVAGKAVARIPWLGWVKIGFTNLINIFL